MTVREETLPGKYHDAVVKWQKTFLPDLGFLLENWDKHFPKDPCFKLCAYRQCGMSDTIEVGEMTGCKKFCQAREMNEKQAHQLLGAVRAQASTEFGSIQQHRLTLARAQDERDQFWVLRMMAEELRHGYQMLHLLLEDDWKSLVGQSGEDMVEEILSMRPGSHVLGAFNIDFDSFVDNVVFCALIDRVGKYQLAMQQVSAYKPMAESMPPMLREEAFHLATGVVPMRRWMEEAAQGKIYISVEAIQKAINKWLPRGLEMFGDERGGGTNIKLGFKDKTNQEALDEYVREVEKLITGLNSRYLRARFPEVAPADIERALTQLMDEGTSYQGVQPEDLLRRPSVEFFRRRGMHAYKMVGIDGESYPTFEAYQRHLRQQLPESYLAGRDFRAYLENLELVASGTLTPEEAAHRTPSLAHVGGACPCSKSVRWVNGDSNLGG
ncbi:MAG: phenylacetate-CoA oxygenase subunit PaaI [Candidatus Eremiobacteraeota bacterium]|nr:phenylacetate-CoA oxygenase subunit PaaI [Candidatus Eremiobacteraeota bacterium]